MLMSKKQLHLWKINHFLFLEQGCTRCGSRTTFNSWKEFLRPLTNLVIDVDINEFTRSLKNQGKFRGYFNQTSWHELLKTADIKLCMFIHIFLSSFLYFSLVKWHCWQAIDDWMNYDVTEARLWDSNLCMGWTVQHVFVSSCTLPVSNCELS